MWSDEPRSVIWGRGLTAALIVAGLVGVWALLRTPVAPSTPAPVVDVTTQGAFDYGPWARVLKAHVNTHGMVDYAGIKAHPADLDAFLAEAGKYSPDRNLAMFTTSAQGLAYWINAYNAWMMQAVVEAYPTRSVQTIGASRGAVFSERTRTCGAVALSLNDIESRARAFGNPMVHFALNCASLGCPPMSRQPFLPDKLDAQLQHAARDALRRQWYCHVSDGGKTVRVTMILKWYADDVQAWMLANRRPASVEGWLALYAPEKIGSALKRGAKVEYIPYDWRLNDWGAKWGKAKRE